MPVDSESFFGEYFVRLTGCTPYPWQLKLFCSFTASPDTLWPEILDLPTGAGKTSVVYVWLLALAWNIRVKAVGVPRRMAWVVNRRVVVDQITTELQEIRVRLELEENAELRQLLASVSSSNTAFAISTLRGEFADNGDWRRDPSAPAVIVGTVDMIGSRLLFRGYRASRYFRPIHAGLLGVDTLIVNDESHLSPAFANLLARLRDIDPAAGIAGKSFRILLLSATHGSASNSLRRFDHEPIEDVMESDTFKAIFHAPKLLSLHAVGSSNELDAAIWKLATDSPPPRTTIFIDQPEKAAKLAGRLSKEGKCALLTGTMRGFERDELLRDETFKRFLDRNSGAEPVWLVCTSAGEVGINFSCERMITLLTEADHLLQRFGRLNRFGNSEPGEAHVVFRVPPEKEEELRNTLSYLRGLAGDVSCAKLWTNRPPDNSCAERPVLARLEDRHIDIWSQTTFSDSAVPAVAPWLHGKQEPDIPETEVAWRSDVELLAEWGVGDARICEVLEYYPVLAREKLREPSVRVARKLAEILNRIGESEASLKKIIIVESDGTVSVRDLAWLVAQTQTDDSYLDYKLLLLPDQLGSVPGGMLSSSERTDSEQNVDVADPEVGGVRIRMRFLFRDGALVALQSVGVIPGGLAPFSTDRLSLSEFASGRYRFPLVISHPNNADHSLLYFGALAQTAASRSMNVSLSQHQAVVAARAGELVCSLALSDFRKTYEAAGTVHDTGKHRIVWQRAMGGSMENPLAKSRTPVNLRLIDGYRHELGSLLDSLTRFTSSADDLLLHLVASHHAAARPFFLARQYDRQSLVGSAEACTEVVRRFARLQRQYGPWGLAYLESVFKCADGLVSASEGEPASA